MQLGEAVAIEMADQFSHDDGNCYFCAAQKRRTSEKNTLTDWVAEDADLDGPQPVRFANDAATLGRALEAAGEPQPTYNVRLSTIDSTGQQRVRHFVVTTAAHHLIPGNASLAKSKLKKTSKYLRTSGMAAGNIAYDINAAENGIWLPGNYAQRPWGVNGATFAAKHGVTAASYAHAAIALGGQFHDSHPAYSKFVRKVLDRLHDKCEAKAFHCPLMSTANKTEHGNLFSLVFRLHRLSARMRRMLAKPGSPAATKRNWRSNIFTSSFVREYVAQLEQPKDDE